MTRVKKVSREKYKGFIEKAEQYYEGMEDEYGKNRANNSITMAVHCAISYVDAFAVLKLGRKSSAQNHAEAIHLLKEAKSTDERQKTQICNNLYQLIEMKTPAEYEDGLLSRKDAAKAKHLCGKIRTFFRGEFEKLEI